MIPFKTKSICIIVCYFGKLPWYFQYFVHSCKFNPTIDFFIITNDDTYSNLLPSNVTFYFKTLEEINSIATHKIGFRTEIQDPYKLCDYKPTFGLLFCDIVKDYDFWGQCDIDVIFGDIRNFIDNNLLEEFDFINVRHDYTAGCFYLFKNNSLLNNLFRQSRDYKKVFSCKEHFCFDECNFAHRLLTEGKSILEIETPIESFTHVIRKAEKNKDIRAYFDFILIEGVPGKIRFNNGHIVYKNKLEAILYHLIGFKKVYHPISIPKEIPDTFSISDKRIYW